MRFEFGAFFDSRGLRSARADRERLSFEILFFDFRHKIEKAIEKAEIVCYYVDIKSLNVRRTYERNAAAFGGKFWIGRIV